jgi:hypothetical protein
MQTEYSWLEVNKAVDALKLCERTYEGSYAGPNGHQMFHVFDGDAMDERLLIEAAWALDPNFLKAHEEAKDDSI